MGWGNKDRGGAVGGRGCGGWRWGAQYLLEAALLGGLLSEGQLGRKPPRAHVLLTLRTAPLEHLPLPTETERQETRETASCGQRVTSHQELLAALPSSAWVRQPGAGRQGPDTSSAPEKDTHGHMANSQTAGPQKGENGVKPQRYKDTGHGRGHPGSEDVPLKCRRAERTCLLSALGQGQ